MNRRNQGHTGLHRLAPTFQNYTITRLNRQTRNLHHRIGPSFKNYAHNAQRTGEPFHNEARIQFAVELDIADRISQFSHIPNPHDRPIELNAIEFQSSVQSRTNVICLGRCTIGFVGPYDRIGVCRQRFCHGFEG